MIKNFKIIIIIIKAIQVIMILYFLLKLKYNLIYA